MKDKVNRFVDNLIGQFVEVSYKEAIYQCMDLAYLWTFCLDIPKSAIQHQYAYEVFEKPNKLTKEYFYLIKNTPDAIPHVGDLVVWKGGKAGHIAIAIGEGDLNSFVVFEQNMPLGTNAHLQERSYTNVLGWLRPKKTIESSDKRQLITDNLLALKNGTSKNEIDAWEERFENQKVMLEDILAGDGGCYDKWIKPHVEATKSILSDEYDKKVDTYQKEIKDAKVEYEKLLHRKVEKFDATTLLRLGIVKLFKVGK